MPEPDDNEEAVRNLEKVTHSEPIPGEQLVEAEDLQRQLREAKTKEGKENGPPSP